jgi:hypothetical protein
MEESAVRIFLGALALVAAAFVLWGVGSAVRRLAKAPAGRWPVSIGIGLAAMVFVGGVLTLAHIAYRPVMWLVVVVALVVAALQARRAKFSFANAIPQDTAGRIELVLAALAIAAMMLFTIATQLPPREFNFQDDLQKYFAHPVRMIETGTLVGSPLSALGSETLGGQAFLHGIVLSGLPLPYVNGVDSVLGLFVMLLIAASAAWRRFGWFPGAAMGALLVAVINPQYVNISGLYTGALLIATAVMLAGDESEDASPVLLGLIYAALVAIKPVYGLFAALHLPLVALASRARSDSWKRALAWAVRVAIWSAAGVAPWVATYLPTYLSRGAFAAQVTPVPEDSAGVSLFSTARVFDGDNVASYTAVAALAAFVAILALIAWRRTRKQLDAKGKSVELFAAAATGVASYLILVLYISKWGGYHPCVRYAVPFALGTSVIAALASPSLVGKLPRMLCTPIPAVALLGIAAAFLPGAAQRYREAMQHGTILSFADATKSPIYAPYIQFSLSDAARQQIGQLQSHVPPGETLLAWIDTPYLLDYRRNRIVDVDAAGTATRWAHIPPEVHYFLWQYDGPAVWRTGDYQFRMHAPGLGARDRLIAKRSFDLANTLSGLANHSEIVAQLNTPSDRYVLFRLGGGGTN